MRVKYNIESKDNLSKIFSDFEINKINYGKQKYRDKEKKIKINAKRPRVKVK